MARIGIMKTKLKSDMLTVGSMIDEQAIISRGPSPFIDRFDRDPG
jgi:hypothetical protein